MLKNVTNVCFLIIIIKYNQITSNLIHARKKKKMASRIIRLVAVHSIVVLSCKINWLVFHIILYKMSKKKCKNTWLNLEKKKGKHIWHIKKKALNIIFYLTFQITRININVTALNIFPHICPIHQYTVFHSLQTMSHIRCKCLSPFLFIIEYQ